MELYPDNDLGTTKYVPNPYDSDAKSLSREIFIDKSMIHVNRWLASGYLTDLKETPDHK